jgi:thiol-disulfide isomerase/thioredoxin
MIVIRIFGTTPPCAKCKRAEQEALKAAARFPGQVEVRKLDALGLEAEPYGLMVTPTIVLDGKVIATGRVIPADQLAVELQKALGR